MAARRGRDISISLSTDLSQFDTNTAERDLESLGDAAETAGRRLGSVGDGADDASREIGDRFGEARDSVKGAANEAAAGFDGSMDGMVGSAQGAVAEIGTSMGGLKGIGLLAGAALAGALYSGMQASKERMTALVQQLGEGIRGLSADGEALGGALGEAFDADAIQDYVDGLPDGQFAKMVQDAKNLAEIDPSITIQTMIEAYNGQSDALERVNAATEAYQQRTRDESAWGTEPEWVQRSNEWLGDRIPLLDDAANNTTKLSEETRNLAEKTEEATAAEQARTEALGGLTQAQIDLNTAAKESLEEVATAADDLSGAMEDLPNGILASAQAAADASTDMRDTLSDNLTDIDGAFAEITARQQADIENTKTYYANLESAYADGGTDLTNWILQQSDPAEAAKLVAMMTPEQKQQIADNYAEAGSLSSKALIAAQTAELDKQGDAAHASGVKVGTEYGKGIAAGIRSQSGAISSATDAATSRRGGSGSWADSTDKKVP